MKLVFKNTLNNESLEFVDKIENSEILEFVEKIELDTDVGVQKLDNANYLDIRVKIPEGVYKWRFYYDVMETYAVNMILNYIENIERTDIVRFTFGGNNFEFKRETKEGEVNKVYLFLEGYCFTRE